MFWHTGSDVATWNANHYDYDFNEIYNTYYIFGEQTQLELHNPKHKQYFWQALNHHKHL